MCSSATDRQLTEQQQEEEEEGDAGHDGHEEEVLDLLPGAGPRGRLIIHLREM
jgi:hypothetical protein